MRLITSFLIVLILLCINSCSSLSKPEDSDVPNYVAHPVGYISSLLPTEDFLAATAWFCGIHLDDPDLPSSIDLDYMRLYAQLSQGDTLLCSDDYNLDGSVNGGLYLKHPWFGGDDQHDSDIPYTAYPDSGYVRLHTSLRNDRVFHLWNYKRSLVPPNALKCWVEVRCRINGPAGVQIGMDFWRDLHASWAGLNVNSVEAGVSNWIFADPNWQVIRFGN